ncbi:MAG: sulfatase-like hydrolase/transferase [bacterium]
MSKQPNILFIITDHQAFHGHHRPGEFEYVWPQFQKFCAAGVRFERAYSVSPICTPARSSMMTGLYPSKHGLMGNSDYGGDFRPDQELYSHFLARAGYRNAYIGKWHCSHTRLPVDYGIEGWALPDYGKVYMSDAYKHYAVERGFGEARANIEYNLDNPQWRGQTITLHHASPFYFMGGSGVMVGPPAAHEEQFVAHLTVNKLKELAQGAQPWSLVSSFWGPHNPYFPSEPFASKFDPRTIPEYPSFRDDLSGRPLRYHMHRDLHHSGARKWTDWSVWQEILAKAYGQGLQTDAAVGEILDALDQSGEADNTIVIWCADHGDAVACHGGLWDKASTFIEEVARVPLAIRWPAGFAGGQVSDQLVSNMDATATMLAAAGVAIPVAMNSRSLLPLCQGDTIVEWPDELVCEHAGHGENFPQRIIMHGRFKYVAALYDGDELYDLKQDPYELRNLINDPGCRDVIADLRRRVLRHIAKINDQNGYQLAYSLKKRLSGKDDLSHAGIDL